MIQRDPELRMHQGHFYDLTRAEDREQTMRQIARVVEIKKQTKDHRLVQALFKGLSYYSESFSMRIYVHEMLFRQALKLFGTAEQQDKWMPDIEQWRVIGCFAMVCNQVLLLFSPPHSTPHSTPISLPSLTS
jgi:acyl-CoA oxidase